MATFYIEAIESTTLKLIKNGQATTAGTCKYGINDTSVPNSYSYGGSISLTAGQKCYFTITATTTAFTASNFIRFTSTGRINAGGNLSDLIGGTDSIPRRYCFCRLFYNCTTLVDASNIVVCTNFNSNSNCYRNMFEGCTSLISVPQLPATTLTSGCYGGMFSGCTSLTTPPQLPAMTLADDCYFNMFYGCTSLAEAPQLPATTMTGTTNYYGMFFNCTSLTTPPQLPATTLTSGCYGGMFSGCKSLLFAPQLPAMSVPDYAYSDMFYDCISLTTPPSLPATNIGAYSYETMFVGCTSLVSLPLLPATTLPVECYYCMFIDCTSIKLSLTEVDRYIVPYRIPSEGIGSESMASLGEMFTGTGGTFTGTPTINTTYYLWQDGEEVSCDIFPDGVGTVTGTGAYAEGEEVTLTATPNSMYNFFAWDLDGTIVSTDNPYTFTMGTEPLAFTAHFIEKPQVTCAINPANYGVVSGTGYYSTGDNVILTATAGTNKVFVDWVIDGVHRTDNPYSFLMPTDSINVTANFRSTIHTVDITPYPQVYGTVTGSGIYNEGTSVTATATPARHKVFYCFGTIVNENYLPMTLPETFGEQAVPISTNNPYTFTVGIEDRTFHAIFRDLAWIDCITDRTQADVNKVKLLNGKLRNGTITQEELAEWALNLKGALNRSDLERIEHNLTIIADKLNYSYDPNIPALPLRNYFEALKTTINILRNKYMVYATTPATPDLPYNHYTKWNDIEKIIEDLYNILKTRGKNYCGEIYCDDIGLI